MKLKLNQPIRRLTVATLCGLFLANVPLPAQEKTDAATNTVAATSAPETNEPAKSLETAITEVVSNAVTTAEASVGGKSHRHKHGGEDALVVIGHDAELKAGNTADAVVVIGGNAVVRGKVLEATVAVGGDVTVSGEVGDAVVAVMGNVKIEDGAIVHGDVVSVGGKVDVAEGATVKGQTQAVDFSAMGLPHVEPLRKWFVHCALKLRLLAPQVGWVWVVDALFLLFYLLLAVALPKPVQACVDELTRRPATTFFMGLLTKLLLPLVMLILVATGIGILVVPFVMAALFFGALIGKVAFLEFLGLSVQRAVGLAATAKPAIALLIGAAILTLLYMIPVVALVTFAITGLWGLGAAVTTAFGSMKREAPEKPTPPPASPTAQAFVPAAGAVSSMPIVAAPAGAAPGETTTPVAPASLQPAAVPSTTQVEAFIFPRASFWERMGAAFLDMVLVGILAGLVGVPPLGMLVALAYFSGMWAWKGTTIGGIVLGLKVVRLDGQPVTFAVALVRALSAAFSVLVLFLGFLWIAWDKDRQGWHDRIAGTVVVRLPRGTPLV